MLIKSHLKKYWVNKHIFYFTLKEHNQWMGDIIIFIIYKYKKIIKILLKKNNKVILARNLFIKILLKKNNKVILVKIY